MASQARNKVAVATVSLGKDKSHTVERKVQAAKEYGFDGIELVWADLQSHAREHSQTPVQSARQIRETCASTGIEILTINPFKHFEGHVEKSLDARLAEAKEWMDIAVALGTDMIQMPSQFLDNSTGDEAIIIPELQALADMAAKDGIRLAYEGVCFAKHNPLWQDALRIVEAVDRPNFKLCLDTYHILGLLWGDPTIEGGEIPDGPEKLEASLREFLERCPRDRVWYVQLSDAQRMDPPLAPDSPLYEGLEVAHPRLAWSRSCRPFPLEGYLPFAEIVHTWLEAWGWEGWVSMEAFFTETAEEENGPQVMAARARKSADSLSSRLTRKSG